MERGQQPSRNSSARDSSRRVRQVLSVLLAGGPLNIDRVAYSVRMTTRTLQRRLSDAGLTYAHVLQSVRFEVAKQLLKDPHRKIGDIARTLGYSDNAHFTRAFQRWTGLSPRAFRRRSGVEAAIDSPPRRRRAPSRE